MSDSSLPVEAPDPSEAPLTHSALMGRRVIARIIDDVLLALISIAIAVNVGNATNAEGGVWYGGSESGWTAYAPLSSDPGGDPPSGSSYYEYGDLEIGSQAGLIVLVGLLATLLFLLYCWWSSRRAGATLGRALMRIRVVAQDGTPAPRRVIFGRELVRVVLVCLAFALIAPAAGYITELTSTLGSDHFGQELGWINTPLSAVLPLALVIAAGVGFTLIDPQGRAPHDRLSRTTVVEKPRHS